MAERRMFSKTIIDSDMFLDMPLSAQALYFHLSMRADDDGFLNNAQKIIRMTNASKNDFDLLLIKSFIIKFEDGVCVIGLHVFLTCQRTIMANLFFQGVVRLKCTSDSTKTLHGVRSAHVRVVTRRVSW